MSRRAQAGVTLVELVLAAGLLALLAGIAMPVAHTMQRRARELELRQNLRLIRHAIDSYRYTVQAVPGAQQQTNMTAEGWPEDLDVLVEGVDLGLASGKKARFLRRIPVDPLTGEAEWGKRSSKQEPTDDMWDGTNVFDVFSLAEGEGLDGTPYKEW